MTDNENPAAMNEKPAGEEEEKWVRKDKQWQNERHGSGFNTITCDGKYVRIFVEPINSDHHEK